MKNDNEQNTIQTDTPEPGSLDAAPDKYADLNEVQLRSSLHARDKDLERLRGIKEEGEKAAAEKLTQVGGELSHTIAERDELKSTVEFQGRTIAEQSETLNNREARCEQLESDLEGLQHVHQAIKNEVTENAAQRDTGELADALQAYALTVGIKATEREHESICVNLIQVSAQIRRMSWGQMLAWFHGKMG